MFAALHDEVVIPELRLDFLSLDRPGVSYDHHQLIFKIGPDGLVRLLVLGKDGLECLPSGDLEIHQQLLVLIFQELQIPIILGFIALVPGNPRNLVDADLREFRLSELASLEYRLQLVPQCYL